MSSTRRLHDRALELAAAALDFGLPPAELAELDGHLAACPACARTAGGLLGDAALLRHPASLLPSRRVDDAVHGAIAGQQPRTSPQRLLVLVAATALLLVALLGVAAAGALLLQGRPPVVVVNPSPSAPPAVVVDPSVSPGPSREPVQPPPAWAQAPGALPAAAGLAQVAAGPDGGMYVLVSTAGDAAAGRPDRSVLGLLDSNGNPRPGWPVAADGWYCDDPTGRPLPPATTSDGSVTVVCHAADTPDGSAWTTAFRFDATGRLAGSWSYPGEVAGRPPVVDDHLVLVATEMTEREATDPGGEMETRSVVAHWILEVSGDGTIRSGARVEMDDAGWYVALGPDGTAYHVDTANGVITAFDMDGRRAGWPVRLGGGLSALGFGADGRVVVGVASSGQGATRLVSLARDGSVAWRTDPLALTGASSWTNGGPFGPLAPLVTDDGTAIVIGEAGGRTVVYAIDPAGKVVDGWPHRSATLPEWQGTCAADVTGCGAWRSLPAAGADGAVYVPLAAPDAQIGGTMAGVGPDGRALPGWPMHLARRGAAFWSVAVGPDGTAYCLAVEPEGGATTSATIVAIARDGTVRSRTTVIQP